MTDTAQPAMAAENAELSLEEAANAFKVHLGQDEAPARDDRGRFAPKAGDEEIEAEAAPQAGEEAADIDVDTGDESEAPDEGQPEPVDMPASWSKDDAEHWSSLPPETQARIAEREGQREAAVNQKFQEAANVRKQAEAIAEEAANSRAHHLATIDQLMQLFESEAPDPNAFMTAEGYDQYGYNLAQHQHAQAVQFKGQLQEQREQLLAQHTEADFQREYAATQAINQVHGRGLVELFPDLGKPETADKALNDLADYAISEGYPSETFKTRRGLLVTALEWKTLWKAREFDRQQAAKAKVRTDPKPQPKPQPAVRPGVAAPRSAQAQAQFKGSIDRLNREGSVEAGAAVFKHLFKGTHR